MKRLSKSASDISNCKKKTYSTSPEEENREFDHAINYTHRRGTDDLDDEGMIQFNCPVKERKNTISHIMKNPNIVSN